MRAFVIVAAIAGLAASAHAQGPAPAAPAASAAAQPSGPVCPGEGAVQLLCPNQRAEDLLPIPGTNWVLASGTLRAINTRDKAATTIYPAPAASDRFDKAKYGNCPDSAKAQFSSLGLALFREDNRRQRLYTTDLRNRVVHVLELEVSGAAAPKATWLGCVPIPEDIATNSVVALPDGSGFVMSSWQPPNGGPDARARMEAGEINGAMYEWRAGEGWSKVAGSETSGANGVEISKDGRTIYGVGWGNRTFFRVTRGANPPVRETVQLDFRADNVHWAPDGSLLAAGSRDGGSRVVKIDPATLKVTPVLDLADSADFGRASVAVDVGGDLWLGSARSDRIAVIQKTGQ